MELPDWFRLKKIRSLSSISIMGGGVPLGRGFQQLKIPSASENCDQRLKDFLSLTGGEECKKFLSPSLHRHAGWKNALEFFEFVNLFAT